MIFSRSLIEQKLFAFPHSEFCRLIGFFAPNENALYQGMTVITLTLRYPAISDYRSDDEEEAAVDHRTPRPAPPKKPAVPVPLPASKPAEPKPKPMEHPTPDRVTSVQETTTAVVPSAAESQEDAETTQPATNTEEEQEDQSAIRPTVVVNDEGRKTSDYEQKSVVLGCIFLPIQKKTLFAKESKVLLTSW